MVSAKPDCPTNEPYPQHAAARQQCRDQRADPAALVGGDELLHQREVDREDAGIADSDKDPEEHQEKPTWDHGTRSRCEDHDAGGQRYRDRRQREPREPDWLASSLVWSILSTWPVALIMFIISSFLYLWYRVKHMVALYKLIEKASVFRFTVKDDQQNERKIVCVANVVSPADELPIFSPQPAEQPRTSARTSSGGARPDEPAAHKAIKESSARADELATHDYYSDQGSGAA